MMNLKLRRARQRKYRQSAKGRVVLERLNTSIKGRARKARYSRSPAGRANKKRFNQSTRGRIRSKEQWHRRRARLRMATGNWSIENLQQIMKKQQCRCLCGVSFKKAKPTIDHKTPLSRGGSNWPRNLQWLCQPCNDSKGSKTMRERSPCGE